MKKLIMVVIMVALTNIANANGPKRAFSYNDVASVLKQYRSVCKVVLGPARISGVPSAGSKEWLAPPKHIRRGEWAVVRPVKVSFRFGNARRGIWNNAGVQTVFVAKGALSPRDYKAAIRMLKTDLGFGRCVSKRTAPDVHFTKPWYIKPPYGVVKYRGPKVRKPN